VLATRRDGPSAGHVERARAPVPDPPPTDGRVGLWFNSPTEAAGCAATVTPFNGEYNARVRAMSTRNFADLRGPLSQLTP
jgi:hypothetical protein